MTAKKKGERKLSEGQQLVNAFLFEPKTCQWPKEVKISNAIIKEHGFEFLMSLKGRIKIPSMCWFLTDKGKRFIVEAKAYQNLFPDRQEIKLEESSVAPATEVNKKPTSFKEFLNIFNKQ